MYAIHYMAMDINKLLKIGNVVASILLIVLTVHGFLLRNSTLLEKIFGVELITIALLGALANNYYLDNKKRYATDERIKQIVFRGGFYAFGVLVFALIILTYYTLFSGINLSLREVMYHIIFLMPITFSAYFVAKTYGGL